MAGHRTAKPLLQGAPAAARARHLVRFARMPGALAVENPVQAVADALGPGVSVFQYVTIDHQDIDDPTWGKLSNDDGASVTLQFSKDTAEVHENLPNAASPALAQAVLAYLERQGGSVERLDRRV